MTLDEMSEPTCKMCGCAQSNMECGGDGIVLDSKTFTAGPCP